MTCEDGLSGRPGRPRQRSGCSLLECGVRAGNWELPAIPGRIVVVGQIDFQGIQLSQLYLQAEAVHVCMHKVEGE